MNRCVCICVRCIMKQIGTNRYSDGAHGADLIARVGPSQAAVDRCGEGVVVGTGRTGGAAGTESGGEFVSCRESDVKDGRIRWTAKKIIVPILISTFKQLSLTDTVVHSYCKSS